MKTIITEQPANNQWRKPHKVIYQPLLGGWFVVRGPHDTPMSHRFATRRDAEHWLHINQRDA